MKKEEEKTHFTIRKNVCFSITCFWPLLWLCISKMICKAWKGVLITFLIIQNGENLRKICQNVW
jgi:hypothetical protein